MTEKSSAMRAYQIHGLHKQVLDFNKAIFHELIFSAEDKQNFSTYNEALYAICGKLSYAVDLAMSNDEHFVDKMLYEVIDLITEVTKRNRYLKDLSVELRQCVNYFLRYVVEASYLLIEQTKGCSHETISK